MNIEIPDDCTVAHLLFSGGADSTLILYLLAREQLHRKNFVVKCYSMNMGKNTVKYARCKHIITEIEKLFGIKIHHYATPRKYFIRDFVAEILTVEDGYVFTGCNKVLDFLEPTNYIENDTPPVRGPKLNDKHLRPFIDMDKSLIIRAYTELNIMNLLDMTYSCGYNHVEPCGSCYFCLEKEWGTINSINIT
jgi:PP-loop superfamily ATP-utilizing enzyme